MSEFDNNNEMISISSKGSDTVIGAQTYFKGTVKTDKPIRIDGTFEGEIDTTDDVVISKGAKFDGVLKCRVLNVFGSCNGTLDCQDLCDVKTEAILSGELTTSNLLSVRGSIVKAKVTVRE